MDRYLKIQNIAFALIFGALGITALVGVVFFGARHQLVVAAISAAMVWIAIAEIRREEKRTKNSTNQ
jgi:hypothetical protein